MLCVCVCEEEGLATTHCHERRASPFSLFDVALPIRRFLFGDNIEPLRAPPPSDPGGTGDNSAIFSVILLGFAAVFSDSRGMADFERPKPLVVSTLLFAYDISCTNCGNGQWAGEGATRKGPKIARVRDR